MLIAPLLALALIGAQPQTPVVVNLNVKDGDVFNVERTIRATVQSEHPVTKVELYVGEDLRDSDSSTPYEFKIDPLSEKEGDLKLTFAAYNTEAQSGRKSVTVKIDTGASKGADALVAEAEKFLINQKWDDAINAGRVALRAKPDYNPARIVLARAFLGKGIFDRAQQFIEDVVASEPNNPEALELLAGINLRKAFNSFSGSNREENVKLIAEALDQAVKSRKKNLDARFDKIGAPTDANRLAYADAAIAAGRYSNAITALHTKFNSDATNFAMGNRLAYAQMRAGRVQDAAQTLAMMKRAQSLDAFGYALYAISETDLGHNTQADDYLKEAIASDPENVGVRTAQVYIALRRGNTSAFSELARSLAADEGPRPEINYYLSILNNQLGNYNEAEVRFQRAVLAEPANYDMYIERGNQALIPVSQGRVADTGTQNYIFKVADAYFTAALLAKPDSGEALVGVAMMHMLQGNTPKGVSFADAAIKATPNYAPAQYLGAAAFAAGQSFYSNLASEVRKKDNDGILDQAQKDEIKKYEDEAKRLEAMSRAAKSKSEQLDSMNLKGRPFPRLLDAFDYYYRYGRLALLPAPRG